MNMKEKVKLKNNGYDGVINIVADDRFDEGFHVAVEVEQKEVLYNPIEKRVGTTVRSCNIRGELVMVMMINKEPGQVMGPGRIVTKDSLIPPFPEDPEMCLLWIDGKVARDEYGNPIYRRTFYTEDDGVQDIILT